MGSVRFTKRAAALIAAAGTKAPTARNLLATATPSWEPSALRATREKVTRGG